MKFLFQPVKPFVINQKFGENNACVTTDGTNKVISCDGNNPPAGYKSLYGSSGHKGLDLRTAHGQEVYCAQDGKVIHIDTNPKSGLDVRVQHEYKGDIYCTIYEHLLGYQPKVGDSLRVGQLIGWADNTGYSSGDHLHFELQKWDGKAWVSTDPMPHMENMFALDWLALEDKVKYLAEVVAKLLDNWASKLRK